MERTPPIARAGKSAGRHRQVDGQGRAGIPSVGDIALIEPAGAPPCVPAADQVGTVCALLDGNGQQANTYEYDAFGVARAASETIPNRYRFGGKPLDADTAHYHFIARQYAPRLGRFWSRDRLFHPGIYPYPPPTTTVDPAGLDCEDPCHHAGQRRALWLDYGIDITFHGHYGGRLHAFRAYDAIQTMAMVYSLQQLLVSGSQGATAVMQHLLGEITGEHMSPDIDVREMAQNIIDIATRYHFEVRVKIKCQTCECRRCGIIRREWRLVWVTQDDTDPWLLCATGTRQGAGLEGRTVYHVSDLLRDARWGQGSLAQRIAKCAKQHALMQCGTDRVTVAIR